MTQDTLNEQLADLSGLLQRGLLSLLGIVLLVLMVFVGVRYLQASDPYIHNVLSLNGNQARGEAIFRMNCAVCHGFEANGEVGPSLHGVSDHKTRVSLIKQVISGNTPPMPQFQPEPQEMADLLEFLESL